LSTGFDAFTGLTKCTYFLSTAVDSGLAPAWRLVDSAETATTKFWDYDLVVSEYFTLQLEASSVAVDPYTLPTGVSKVPDVVIPVLYGSYTEVATVINEVETESGGGYM